MNTPAEAKRTPLYGLHRELGAKETVFGGYLMPLAYPGGALQEHRHTRAHAGLFDISHMGQARISAAPDALERVAAPFTGDVDVLPAGDMLYTLMTNRQGGIRDDVIIARLPEEGAFHITVNAGGKAENLAYLAESLQGAAQLHIQHDKALLALQGPKAAQAAEALLGPSLAGLGFMQCAVLDWRGATCLVARCGYTGEDGFEISLPAERAEEFARAALACPEVAPAGLGARDSLRLEAGLCLYGQDINAETTPVEAGLGMFVSKRRRQRRDFPGSDIILAQLSEGAPRRLVGLLPEGKALLRPGAQLHGGGGPVGAVTSGGFGASLGAPVALGHVARGFDKPGSEVHAEVRGRQVAARVARLPFVPHNYHRGRKQA